MDPKTIRAYDNLAQKYDEETSDFWDRFPRTFFEKFIELSKGRVLDVGSGPGRDGIILQNAGLKVVCIDASDVMVKMSTAKGLESYVADFAKLPFEDNVFDGVWAYTSLLHVPKNEISIPMQEIMRVLKPNGIFGLGLIEGATEEYRVTEKVNEPRWFSFYTTTEIEGLLAQHGFEIMYFEQFKPNTKNYLNYISRKIDNSPRDLDKFNAVAGSYSEKFGFKPYYSALVEVLEKYCDRVHCVLEIGAANGIVPQMWDKIRKVGEGLEYYSVDPSPKMVQQAKSVAETLSMRYHPTLGYIENALEVCGLMNKKLNLLILSRSLHEIYLGHGRDIEKVFSNLSKLIEQSNPDFVVIGDAERNAGLSLIETQRFTEQQAATIGHGHDPAIDYLDFSKLITFMCAAGYQFLDEKGVVQPLDGFEVSPWKFRIVAFEKS